MRRRAWEKQGWQGRGGARGAGRQKATPPAFETAHSICGLEPTFKSSYQFCTARRGSARAKMFAAAGGAARSGRSVAGVSCCFGLPKVRSSTSLRASEPNLIPALHSSTAVTHHTRIQTNRLRARQTDLSRRLGGPEFGAGWTETHRVPRSSILSLYYSQSQFSGYFRMK